MTAIWASVRAQQQAKLLSLVKFGFAPLAQGQSACSAMLPIGGGEKIAAPVA